MNNPLKTFREMDSSEMGFILFGFSGTLAPGILSIWLYNPALMLTATTPKLILLAISITVPIASFNTAVFALTRPEAKTEEEKEERNLAANMGVGTLFTLFNFVVPLLLKVFFDITLRKFLLFAFLGNLAFFIWRLWVGAKSQLEEWQDQQTNTKA